MYYKVTGYTEKNGIEGFSFEKTPMEIRIGYSMSTYRIRGLEEISKEEHQAAFSDFLNNLKEFLEIELN